jgi:hypothetical protein
METIDIEVRFVIPKTVVNNDDIEDQGEARSDIQIANDLVQSLKEAFSWEVAKGCQIHLGSVTTGLMV